MKMPQLGRSIVALALSAGLTLSSFGPGACQALAANIQTGTAKALPGTPQVAPLPNTAFPASPGSFSGLAGTPVSLNSTIPSLSAPEIQAVTGGMYFLLFLPDILSILRGKAPKGFTTGVSLSFFVASLGFILWTGQTVLETPGGTPKHQQFLIYLALNIAYAVVSGASWLIARRGQKS